MRFIKMSNNKRGLTLVEILIVASIFVGVMILFGRNTEDVGVSAKITQFSSVENDTKQFTIKAANLFLNSIQYRRIQASKSFLYDESSQSYSPMPGHASPAEEIYTIDISPSPYDVFQDSHSLHKFDNRAGRLYRSYYSRCVPIADLDTNDGSYNFTSNSDYASFIDNPIRPFHFSKGNQQHLIVCCDINNIDSCKLSNETTLKTEFKNFKPIIALTTYDLDSQTLKQLEVRPKPFEVNPVWGLGFLASPRENEGIRMHTYTLVNQCLVKNNKAAFQNCPRLPTVPSNNPSVLEDFFNLHIEGKINTMIIPFAPNSETSSSMIEF